MTNERSKIYEEIIPQVRALLEEETNMIANMANITAVIKEAFGFHWVGFYLAKAGELVLGPFQGPVACTRIAYGKGVCGTAWKEERSIVVRDVNEFPGHIACSTLSRSEVVVPVNNSAGKVVGVLDIDSVRVADLNELDKKYLEIIVALLMEKDQHAQSAL